MIVIRRRKEIFGRSSAEVRPNFSTRSACVPEHSASAEHYEGHVRCISSVWLVTVCVSGWWPSVCLTGALDELIFITVWRSWRPSFHLMENCRDTRHWRCWSAPNTSSRCDTSYLYDVACYYLYQTEGSPATWQLCKYECLTPVRRPIHSKLWTSNSTCMFPGTVRTWSFKFF